MNRRLATAWRNCLKYLPIALISAQFSPRHEPSFGPSFLSDEWGFRSICGVLATVGLATTNKPFCLECVDIGDREQWGLRHFENYDFVVSNFKIANLL